MELYVIALIIIAFIIILNWETFQVSITQTALGPLYRPIVEKKTIAPRFMMYQIFDNEYKVVDLTNVPASTSAAKYQWADVVLRRKPAGYLGKACSEDELLEMLRARGWLYISDHALKTLTAIDMVEIERRLTYLADGIEIGEPLDPIQAEIELIDRKDISRGEVISTLKGFNKVRSKVVSDQEAPDEIVEDIPVKKCTREDDANCRDLALQDKCFEDPQYMYDHCPNVCNMCGVKPEDIEKIKDANLTAGKCTWRPGDEDDDLNQRFLF